MQTETLNTISSVAESQKPDVVVQSIDKKKDEGIVLTSENCRIQPIQSFGMYNSKIYKNMEFIDESNIEAF